MAEQRFTVGDQITVVVTGEMTGITPDGTLTVQYPSSLGACETHVELKDTSVVVMHERDADKATPVLIEERDSARAEVKRLRAERTIDLEALRVAAADLKHARAVAANAEKTLGEQIDRAIAAEAERDRLAEQAERVRARHTGVCSGACGLDDACECEDRDLICAEDNDRWPCATIRALDGTEAGQ